MKRMIRAASRSNSLFNEIQANKSSSFQPERFRNYYIDELIDDEVIDETEIEDVLAIDPGELTEEDMDLFLRGIQEYSRIVDISSVDIADIDPNNYPYGQGLDGAYIVKYRDGMTALYGWNFGDPKLFDLHLSKFRP